MRIDDFSLAFNCPGCPSWGTAIVNQDTKKLHLIKKDVASNIVIGMMHKCVTINTHDFPCLLVRGQRFTMVTLVLMEQHLNRCWSLCSTKCL